MLALFYYFIYIQHDSITAYLRLSMTYVVLSIFNISLINGFLYDVVNCVLCTVFNWKETINYTHGRYWICQSCVYNLHLPLKNVTTKNILVELYNLLLF